MGAIEYEIQLIQQRLDELYLRLREAETREGPIIAARYTSTSGQSVPNATDVLIDFATKDYDTYNAVTTGASWKFTAPIGGYYQINVMTMLDFSNQWTPSEYLQLHLRVNGTIVSKLDYDHNLAASVNQYGHSQGADCLYLAQGDYVAAHLYQTSGVAQALLTTADWNNISIFKVRS